MCVCVCVCVFRRSAPSVHSAFPWRPPFRSLLCIFDKSNTPITFYVISASAKVTRKTALNLQRVYTDDVCTTGRDTTQRIRPQSRMRPLLYGGKCRLCQRDTRVPDCSFTEGDERSHLQPFGHSERVLIASGSKSTYLVLKTLQSGCKLMR